MDNFSEIELDALKEFVSVGTAHAATALSKLIDKEITVSTIEFNIVPINQVPEKLGGAEIPIVGLYFRLSGYITGNVLLFFPKETATAFLDIMFQEIERENNGYFNDIEISALMELGNILTNSYINVFAEMLNARVLISVPFFSSDLLGAVIDFLLIELSAVADYALLMETVIEAAEMKFKGNFLIFPDSESFKKIFERSGLRS